MVFLDSLRKRFSSTLESHQIDEDYTVAENETETETPIASASCVASGVDYMAIGLDPRFDPDEAVPSYETSQMLHDRSNNASNISISRNSSFVADMDSIAYLDRPTNVTAMASSTSAANPASATSRKSELKRNSLKQLGLKFLNARQHFALAISRDVSLIPPLIGLIQSWKRAFVDSHYMVDSINSANLSETSQHLKSITSARQSEHFLTGLWCLVAAYLSYSVLDGLTVRWIVTYSTSAAIVRVLSMSTIIIAVEQYLVATFSAYGYKYGLHIWLLISCCLTFGYIVQNFVTSNLDLKKGAQKRARFFDFYNIVVFAVVPVGLASFITMIGLLRSLLILRIDIDQTFGEA
ncbi:predicted protein [Scheffersomyces stipitis CBS 6054]|uniref:N-glycosylation protein EOS1 n=1 Tax=Scheffersomyces stipitis (strain ATCC 58785 / CBS 6054 / NBRC 10063 / NRRL Y-11545) TaxID=322104 RepID=A3LSG5_PICST|nr:predicted protein [Scheffersomyces stipitis CBS 6054]ABN65899.2 predicted protein [Scheffersomyces stipitis CBS 6054]